MRAFETGEVMSASDLEFSFGAASSSRPRYLSFSQTRFTVNNLMSYSSELFECLQTRR